MEEALLIAEDGGLEGSAGVEIGDSLACHAMHSTTHLHYARS